MIDPEIQSFVQQQIAQAQQTSRYSTANSTYHVHSGLDSPKIDPADLNNANQYFAIANVTVTSAQVLTLNSATAVVLVAGVTTSGQGSSAVIIIENITARNNFNSVAYTGTNALEFRYTDASGVKAAPDMSSSFINSPINTVYSVNGNTTNFVPVPGASVVLSVPVANPAAGNSVFTFIIKYRVVPI